MLHYLILNYIDVKIYKIFHRHFIKRKKIIHRNIIYLKFNITMHFIIKYRNNINLDSVVLFDNIIF